MRTLILLSVALLAAGPALAQAPPDAPREGPVRELDTDRDGSLSRAEAAANPDLAARFATLDRNANGALEPSEFARFETLGAESTSGNPPTRNRGVSLRQAPRMDSPPPPQ